MARLTIAKAREMWKKEIDRWDLELMANFIKLQPLGRDVFPDVELSEYFMHRYITLVGEEMSKIKIGD